MQGPNVKKLIARKMSRDAIPDGGGFADGVKFLMDPQRVGKVAREATEWVTMAIQAVRKAAEPNPWKGADDETIAGEILQRIEKTPDRLLGCRADRT
jgi:hypothetical protein